MLFVLKILVLKDMYCCPTLMISLQKILCHFSIRNTLKSLLEHFEIYILCSGQGSLALRGNAEKKTILFTNLNAISVTGITLDIQVVLLM